MYSVNLPMSVYKGLKVISSSDGVPMSKLVSRCLSGFIDQEIEKVKFTSDQKYYVDTFIDFIKNREGGLTVFEYFMYTDMVGANFWDNRNYYLRYLSHCPKYQEIISLPKILVRKIYSFEDRKEIEATLESVGKKWEKYVDIICATV